MFTLIKKLLWDETTFIGILRGVLLGAGTAVSTDMVDVSELGIPKVAGLALIMAGGFVRSTGAGADTLRREKK